MREGINIHISLSAFVLAISSPIVTAQTFDIGDYMEGNFDYDKWYGTTSETLRVRAFTQHNHTYEGLLDANWDLHEATGPNGGPLEDGGWTDEPFKHINSWHMKTFGDGTVREVGDSFPDRFGDECTIVYDDGKSILWGVGNMEVGVLYDNQLHFTGGCGENWGWVDVRIIKHHATYTIPEITAETWSCPSAKFNDVLEIEITQWFCQYPNCATQNEDRQRYWFARDFGAIQLWSQNGFVIRRLFDEDFPENSMCAGDWIAQQ